MLKLLFDIIIGNFCKHNYVLERPELDLISSSSEKRYGLLRLYKCSKCGKFKQIKLENK